MIQEQLVSLTEGLFFMSESDYPFEIIATEMSGSCPEDLLMAYLAEMGQVNISFERRSLSDFFRNSVRIDEGMGEEELALVGRFQQLIEFLSSRCVENIEVFRLGNEVEKDVYIVGQTGEGENLILKTKVVET